jgi:hypothetical protein
LKREIFQHYTNVIALKYAQEFYGADMKISNILEEEGTSIDSLRPLPNKYCYVETGISNMKQSGMGRK